MIVAAGCRIGVIGATDTIRRFGVSGSKCLSRTLPGSDAIETAGHAAPDSGLSRKWVVLPVKLAPGGHVVKKRCR